MKLSTLAVLLACLSSAAGAASTDSDLEYRVKAAFLYNFAKFVEWPAEKFAGPNSPIELCVLEPDPFGAVLVDTVRGKTVGRRPIAVRRSQQVSELRSCHLLYASNGNGAWLEAEFAQLAGASVMTVHEAPQALSGGVIRFFVDERKVRFEINAASAERAGLQLNAKLQSVADVVRR